MIKNELTTNKYGNKSPKNAKRVQFAGLTIGVIAVKANGTDTEAVTIAKKKRRIR